MRFGLVKRSAAGCARGRPPRVAPARALRASVAIVLLLPYLTGCYQHVPVSHTALSPGADVSVRLTDQGRVALSESLGPGVLDLGGRVAARTDSSVVLSVHSVRYADLGVPVRWAGERVEIAYPLIGNTRERRLSRTRTAVMAALVVAGVVASSFIAIRGFGGDPPPERPPREPDVD